MNAINPFNVSSNVAVHFPIFSVFFVDFRVEKRTICVIDAIHILAAEAAAVKSMSIVESSPFRDYVKCLSPRAHLFSRKQIAEELRTEFLECRMKAKAMFQSMCL